MDATFEALQQGDLCQVTLAGELTIYTVDEFKKKLLTSQQDCQQMEINLSQVEELDTAGVQLLVLLKREARQAGKTLTLVCHSAAILEVMELLKLEVYFGDPLVLTP